MQTETPDHDPDPAHDLGDVLRALIAAVAFRGVRLDTIFDLVEART